MEIIRVGVDLAKNVYQVHGVDRKDEPVWRRQLSRQNWLAAIVKKVEAGNEIGIEACAGHWNQWRFGEGQLCETYRQRQPPASKRHSRPRGING